MMSRILQKYSIYELVVMAIIATIGIAIKPVVVPIAHLVTGPLMIPSGAFAGGLYMMWLVIGYGIVKKVGTATIIALIQAILVVITGVIGSHGAMSFITYIAPGIAMDLALLLLGHRVCCRGCAMIAGGVANLTGTACVNVLFFQVPGAYLILILSVATLSGCLGGLLAWELLKIMDKYHMIPKKSERKEKIAIDRTTQN